jgi:Fe-S-cluster containining protein
MNCTGCPAPCCRDVVYLTPREFKTLCGKTSSLKCTQIGEVTILSPCPFLVDNRCTIYADRPLACQRYPLTVQYREKSVLLVLHFKCPQVPKPGNGDQVLATGDLERMGISPAERRQMLVTNLLLDAEIGRAWKKFTLKERNKMRIFEAKTKQPNPGADAILMVIPLEQYANLVQAVEEILEKDSKSPYVRLSKIVAESLHLDSLI